MPRHVGWNNATRREIECNRVLYGALVTLQTWWHFALCSPVAMLLGISNWIAAIATLLDDRSSQLIPSKNRALVFSHSWHLTAYRQIFWVCLSLDLINCVRSSLLLPYQLAAVRLCCLSSNVCRFNYLVRMKEKFRFD